MSDYGMKVSRQGYDVTTAADHQMLWSSSFKMPLVLFQGGGTFDINSGTTLVTHNLGYYPFSIIVTKGTSDGSDLIWCHNKNGDFGLAGILIGTDNISYISTTFGNPPYAGDKVIYDYWVFNHDLSTPYVGSVVDNSTDSQGGASSNYGFKVSATGFDVGTASLTNLQSFSGNSTGTFSDPVRHQIIHRIGTFTGTSGSTYQFAHGLGYKPFFQFYVKQIHATGTGYFMITQITNGISGEEKYRLWADNTNINFFNNTGGNRDNVTCVVLKDPLTS